MSHLSKGKFVGSYDKKYNGPYTYIKCFHQRSNTNKEEISRIMTKPAK